MDYDWVTLDENHKTKEISFKFPDVMKNIGDLILHQESKNLLEGLFRIYDEIIASGNKLILIDHPLCLFRPYALQIHFEDDGREYFRYEECDKCEACDSCNGFPNDVKYYEYFKKALKPLNESSFMTDNEKCMLKILGAANGALTSSEILKIAPKYSICADCSSGTQVISAGDKLVRKGKILRDLEKDGYVWSLNQDSEVNKG